MLMCRFPSSLITWEFRGIFEGLFQRRFLSQERPDIKKPKPELNLLALRLLRYGRLATIICTD